MKEAIEKIGRVTIPEQQKGEQIYQITTYGEHQMPISQYDVPAFSARKAYKLIMNQISEHKSWSAELILER